MTETIKTTEPEMIPHEISYALAHVLSILDTLKPNDRSRLDRHYAVVINDVEHVIAYVDRWIVFGESSHD